MITSVELVQLMPPPVGNQSPQWLQFLVNAVDVCIKRYCKQNLEQATYTEFYSGDGRRDVILNQVPVQSIASVNLDDNGFFGQSANGFGTGTLLTQGANYVLILDKGGTQSNRGLLRMIAAAGGTGSFAFFPYGGIGLGDGGKLAARRMPFWPRGDGNIKVTYTAGYAAPLPADLVAAANELVAWSARNLPIGAFLESETLGQYSYTIMHKLMGLPELMTVRQILSTYRDFTV